MLTTREDDETKPSMGAAPHATAKSRANNFVEIIVTNDWTLQYYCILQLASIRSGMV